MNNYTIEDQLFSKMSTLFLDRPLPLEIITIEETDTEDSYWELAEDFIRDHKIVDLPNSHVLELIEESVSMAIRYHYTKKQDPQLELIK
jgi:hypothetical protein